MKADQDLHDPSLTIPSRTMRPRIFKTLLGLALAGAVLGCILVVFLSDETRSVKLADGSEVRIVQMTFGTEHRLVAGPAWQRLLRFLPAKAATALGLNVVTDYSSRNALFVWVEWRNRAVNAPAVQKLRVLDTNDLYAGDVFVRRSISQSNTLLTAFELFNFPRQRSRLRMQWFAATSASFQVKPGAVGMSYVQTSPSLPFSAAQPFLLDPLAEFRVSNPGFARRPLPQARWPSVAKAEGEEFELLGIQTGLVATGVLSGKFVSNQCTEILFRMGTNMPGGVPVAGALRDWSLQTVELQDLFGNRVEQQPAKWRVFAISATDYRMRADDGIARVPGSLWTGQDWNVRATFARNGTPSLSEAYRWRTRIPVPVIGTRWALSVTGQVQGCAIKLKSMDNVSWVFGRGLQEVGPRLDAWFEVPQPAWRLAVLDVQDQRGSNIAHRAMPEAPPRYCFQFSTALESRDLEVTFGVLPVVTVELSAKPEMAGVKGGGRGERRLTNCNTHPYLIAAGCAKNLQIQTTTTSPPVTHPSLRPKR